MKKYLQNLRQQEPHVRRTHALRLSGALVGLFFIAWVATLPARLNTTTVAEHQSDQAAAAAGAAYTSQNQLEVSSTTPYTQ